MNWRTVLRRWTRYAARRWERMYREDFYLRLFALAVAVILWFLAGAEEHVGVVERVVSVSVQVENMPEEYELTVEPDPVQVRLRGITPLMALAERDTEAVVDLRNVSEGSGTYSVRVSVPTGVEVVSVSPRWVGLETERIVTEVFPVSLAFVGLPSGETPREVDVRPVEVTAQGRRSVMAQVAQVVVYVPLIASDTPFSGEFPPHALDSTGRVQGQISFEPRVVLVEVK